MVQGGSETPPPRLKFQPGPGPALADWRTLQVPSDEGQQAMALRGVAAPLVVSARPVPDPQGMGGSHPLS